MGRGEGERAERRLECDRMDARSAGILLILAVVPACDGDDVPSPDPSPIAAEAPWFTEEAAERGITLLNGSGRPRRKELVMETVGPGAAILDVNGDGLLDAFLPNGSWLEGELREDLYKGGDRPRSALYVQRPGGTFVNEAKERGVEDDAWGFGACAADLDNDGDEDLLVSNLGPNRLYVNDGTGHFTEIAARAGISGPADRGAWEWSTGIAVGDYDRDGVLDVYIASYADMFTWLRESPEVKRGPDGGIVDARVCTWQQLLVYCGPLGLPGQQDHLYRGLGGHDGDLRFEDRTKQSGVWRTPEAGGPLYGFQPLFTDLNNDGWPDLYVANDSVPSLCFLNRRDGTFRECASELGIALSESGEDLAGMGAASVDLNGDGWLDVLKTNFAFETNNIYVAEPIAGPKGAVRLTYRDQSPWNGVKADVYPDLSWAVLVFDFDHDMDQDIFYANGHVYPEVDSVPALGTSFDQFNKLFRNVRRGGEVRFERVGGEAGPGLEVKKASRGASLWDFDNDGDLDILVVNLNSTPDLLVNRRGSASGHWLELKLVGNVGKGSNRDAVGSRVRVTTGGRTQHFEVKRGEGLFGNHDPRVHAGLGPNTGPVEVEITWPNGETTRHALEAVDRVVTIAQP